MALIKPYTLNEVMEIFQNILKVKRARSIDLNIGKNSKTAASKGFLTDNIYHQRDTSLSCPNHGLKDW